TGADAAAWGRDWTGAYVAEPLCVVRPGSTAEVAAVVRACAAAGVAVVPAGGRTGLVGGLMNRGAVMVSLERMAQIREVRPGARLVVAEAGVVLSRLHEAAEAHGLLFPLWFGARGSATLGGALSTNAGGSNVLRHGSTRGLCLGIEVVLADGRVLDLMGQLHKDNSGYDLRDLFIGAEGTLGIITAAVMRLVPAPLVQVTALLALDRLEDALTVLNRLQAETGGGVEAFEYMPAAYLARLARLRPDLAGPLAPIPPLAILVEVGSTRPEDAAPTPEGPVLAVQVERVLADLAEAGLIRDAVLARSAAQRAALWARREAAAEITFAGPGPILDTDVAVPLDAVPAFVAAIGPAVAAVDPGAETLAIAHLGDGNLHFTVYPTRTDAGLKDVLLQAIEGVVADLGGSFSAEHGVGLSKLASMRRRKDPVAIEVMRAVKAALDPAGTLNPGKVIP
ncbi:MAG: FAD-binding oxidoreductase, partial [Rhodobacterales bacterium]|nr:FAD-binding oxidoreductase [Rhodobacterales bacterium]